jgi:hypothetical protein
MKKPLIFLLQLFVFISLNTLFSQSRNFDIIFRSEKVSYAEYEEIILNIKLYNVSERTDSVWVCGEPLYDIITNLTVTDSSGKKYKYVGAVIDCMDYYVKLRPGKFLERNFPLLSGYGDTVSDFYKGRDFLKEGVYTISFDGKSSYHRPVMKSNEIKIKIIKPAAEDNYEGLKEIFLMSDENKENYLGNYIHSNPESAYLDIAYRELLWQIWAKKLSYKNIINDFKFYISKRYNSWSVYDLMNLFSSVMNKTVKDDILENVLAYVIKKYPGSKACESAYKILRREIPNEFYIQNLLR